MIIFLTLALTLGLCSDSMTLPGTRVDLRDRVELARQDGISVEELVTLADEGLRQADAAGSPRAYWGAMTLVAELCKLGPAVEARPVRVRALASLVRHDSDTLRWSTLVTRSFLPNFKELPRALLDAELACYDQALEGAGRINLAARVQAELSYAKAYARIHINRRWDWLSHRERQSVLEGLKQDTQRFKGLAVPGAWGKQARTVAQRARDHEYELTQLYFGAQAPALVGVDLHNEALNIKQSSGQVIVVDFWTSFCQPCLALVPGVKDLLREFESEAIAYYGVCGDGDRLQGLATSQRVGMTWSNLWDGSRGPDGPAARAYNVPALGWPSVFVIDQEGRIRYKFRGQEQVEKELAEALRSLLKEGHE